MKMLFINCPFGLQVKYDGMTGLIEFDNLSLRSNISVEILELGDSEMITVGTWAYGYGNWTDRLKIDPKKRKRNDDDDDVDDSSMEGVFLKILTILVSKQTM